MNLDAAQHIAEQLRFSMLYACETVKIAGSIRRRKAEVKDIELVAVPKFKEVASEGSLFPEPITVNLLYEWATHSNIKWIKTGVEQIVPWTIKPDGKYWRGLLPTGIKLDLFIANPRNFGLIYLIRTGSKDFSAALLGYAKHQTPYQTERSYYEEHPELPGKPETGYLVEKATGKRVDTPTERTVFNLLSLQYVQPPFRTDGDAIRRKQ